jgi:hypothetical protein
MVPAVTDAAITACGFWSPLSGTVSISVVGRLTGSKKPCGSAYEAVDIASAAPIAAIAVMERGPARRRLAHGTVHG